MPDVVEAAARSRMMSNIRGKNTQPELRIRRRFHAGGLRYRLHARDLPGKPDIIFRGIRMVVFVHGCFWHQHSGCRLAARPGSNVEFWRAKLQANVDRDRKVLQDLRDLGWMAEVTWECATDHDLDELTSAIKGQTEEKRSASFRKNPCSASRT